MKFCKDCAYFRRRTIWVGFVDECTHPKAIRTINMVNGDITYMEASQFRDKPALIFGCGIGAKYFTPIKVL